MAIRRIILAIAVLAAISGFASAQEAAVPELFGVPAFVDAVSLAVSNAALFAPNVETVTLNESALNANNANITLGGVEYRATRMMVENRRDHQAIGWVSRWSLDGVAWPSTLTMRNGLVAGTFFDRDGRQFFLMPGYGPTQELIKVEMRTDILAKYIRDDTTPPVQRRGVVAEQRDLAQDLVTPPVGGWEVTLLELYTQSASDYVGSDAGVEAVIANKVDCINTALLNSGYTDGHVRLVHVQRWSRNESGDKNVDLNALATDPAIEVIRNAYGADLVGEAVAIGGGVAFAPWNEWDRSTGFHLMNIMGMVSEYGWHLEHEWAHNMRAMHDLAALPPYEGDMYPDARAYIDGWNASIVAYSTLIRPFYSTPLGAWQGHPMGSAAENNLRVIALAFEAVSQYSGTGTASECIPSSTALCLLRTDGGASGSSRFKVEVVWRTLLPSDGQGQAVAMSNDTGYFWFFDPGNVEMVIKVLDGRPVNGSFWVFAGGLTNVEVDVYVTDMVTGSVWHRQNPMGTMFEPMQDVNAFPQ